MSVIFGHCVGSKKAKMAKMGKSEVFHFLGWCEDGETAGLRIGCMGEWEILDPENQ